jgi:hypothetical protein
LNVLKKIPLRENFGRRNNQERKKKKERKDNINSGHYILPAMTKSTVHTSLGPKILTLVTQE